MLYFTFCDYVDIHISTTRKPFIKANQMASCIVMVIISYIVYIIHAYINMYIYEILFA